jgi:hypothetical protein
MIRDAQTAKRVLDLMDEADKRLVESLEIVRTGCSDEEYKAYQAAMAQVAGRLFFLLMEPIYCEHPSLAPPDAPSDFVERWKKSKAAAELDLGKG